MVITQNSDRYKNRRSAANVNKYSSSATGYATVRLSQMSESVFAMGEHVAKSLKDSEKFNEITVYSQRAVCALRTNRRRTMNGQWANHNRTVGEP